MPRTENNSAADHRNAITTYRERDCCPHCEADLKGAPIPEEDLHLYYPPGTPDADLKPKHYRREIMVQVSEVYDGGLYFKCPDCGGTWPRFLPEENAHLFTSAVVLTRNS